MAVSEQDAYAAALNWINTAESAEQLVKEFVPDPSIRSFRPRTLSLGLATEILRFRDQQPFRRLRRLEDLLQIKGVDKTLIQDLVYTGRTILESEPEPKPEPKPEPEPEVPAIGVLLPLRLETRFYPPEQAGASWRLRLRIIPDRASMDTHDPSVSEAEFESVVAFWTVAEGDIGSDAGKDAWRIFAARVSPARAAWLAQRFSPASDGSITPPPAFRVEPRFSVLRGLPEALEVWLARAGSSPQQVAVLQVDQGIAEMGFPDLESGYEHWWHSYAKAEAVGLATELDLGPEAPGDIDALYVVGLGTEAPNDLFEAHRDAGAIGLIAPGSPTNTVDGTPAADLGDDVELWRRIAAGELSPQAGAQKVSQMLTGKAATFETVPGGEADPGPLNQSLVRALWPALWGHMAKDILGLGAEVHQAGIWAGDNLYPEGPLPALRIDDQPYGLLPAVSLDDWLAAGGEPEVEENMRVSLIRLRDHFADAAEAIGNVAGTDTPRLLELLGQTASSNGYAYRAFQALEALYFDYGIFGNTVFGLQILRAWWEAQVAEVKSYPVDIQRAYLTLGHPQDLRIPLVEPDNLPEWLTFQGLLAEIATVPPAHLLSDNFRREFLGGEDPNSLLVRLIMHALIVAGAELGREQAGITGPVLEPMSAAGPATRLEQDVESATYPPPDPSTPAAQLLIRAQAAVGALAGQPVDALERAFKAVLDTAMHRVDPWITAYAWRRLDIMARKEFPHRLGLYGWVDAPAPGTPGPTAGGLLLAPSANQAHTAIILRDKAIHDPEADRWRMNLESRTIRIADRLASEVRLGFHLHEVVGREVERIVGDADRVDALRAHYPIRAAHAGRRVCNGQAVLEEAPATLGAPPIALGAATLDALEPLRDALDVYGDLLVAQAVHHVVAGRADAAGAAMDAAAGLTVPPDLEVIRTPRSGRAVGTSVLFCLPPDGDEPLMGLPATASPTRIADPAVAAWIAAEAGFASEPGAFDWRVSTAAGAVEGRTLGQLGLVPSDTCTLSAGALRELVLDSVEDGVEVLADAPGDRAHARARAIVTLLGHQPAVPEDLVARSDETTPGEDGVANELRQRLASLRDVGVAMVGELQAAFASADDATKTQALADATRWGIVPLRAARHSLQQRTADARDALQARLDAAPEGPAADPLGAAELARAIAELTAPDGHYAVLGRIDFDQVTTTFGPDALDEEWLSLNSMVRPILANLETYQLQAVLDGAALPLSAWSSRPADPWQANEQPGESGRVPDTHLVAAFGPAGVLNDPSGVLAVGLIDSWSEVVPDTDHISTGAFGFDAPGARAPQAILLAVPPSVDATLDGKNLINIVAETRRLARARMVTPKQLASLAGALPSAMIPGAGTTGVSLTPYVEIVID